MWNSATFHHLLHVLEKWEYCTQTWRRYLTEGVKYLRKDAKEGRISLHFQNSTVWFAAGSGRWTPPANLPTLPWIIVIGEWSVTYRLPQLVTWATVFHYIAKCPHVVWQHIQKKLRIVVIFSKAWCHTFSVKLQIKNCITTPRISFWTTQTLLIAILPFILHLATFVSISCCSFLSIIAVCILFY